MNQRAVTLAVVALALITGCHKPGPAAPAATFTHIDPATAGAIEGTIHFDKPAPKRIEIDMAQDPACAMTGGTNLSEEYVVNGSGKDGGKLANVYVYVKSGLGDKTYPVSSAPVVLDQKGCRYAPHVIAAQVGQPVEFRNSDATMHNVHMEPTVGGNQAVDISQPPNGGTTQHTFVQPETMIPVRCNNHPWMQAFINIAPNPFYAVSDQSGHFVINGLPPGVYTLVAVHEQLGAQEASVTVTSHGTTISDFHYGTK